MQAFIISSKKKILREEKQIFRNPITRKYFVDSQLSLELGKYSSILPSPHLWGTRQLMAITFINWMPALQTHFQSQTEGTASWMSAEKSAVEKLQQQQLLKYLVGLGFRGAGVWVGGAALNLAKCWPRMRNARQNCWNLIPQGLLERAVDNAAVPQIGEMPGAWFWIWSGSWKPVAG